MIRLQASRLELTEHARARLAERSTLSERDVRRRVLEALRAGDFRLAVRRASLFVALDELCVVVAVTRRVPVALTVHAVEWSGRDEECAG